MVTLNSTIISGANALAAIRPLLTDNAQLLLVTDGNIARLEAAKQIRSILEEGNRRVTVIDTVPPEPSHHDVIRSEEMRATGFTPASRLSSPGDSG